MLENALYMPSSPVNLISVTTLAHNWTDESLGYGPDSGTWIRTHWDHSVFTWDNEKYKRTVLHPSSDLPEMQLSSNSNIASFYSRVINTSKYIKQCAFLSKISHFL